MDRRDFFGGALAGSLLAGAQAAAQTNPAGDTQSVTIERAVEGRPHEGKVLALVTPHLDDGPIFAGGTLAKLLREGYTGYFIRTSNDEKDSAGLSLGATVLANERDTASFVRTMGLKGSFDLSYRNHRMDDVARTELRGRLIFLIRLLKIDTVLCYDPWGHYEENPDHYVTAQAVEAACWMAAGGHDFPEHLAAGLKPHGVQEKYYFARGPQLVNRVVDTTGVIEEKRRAILSCHTMIEHMVSDLNASLRARNQRIPALEGPGALAEFVRVAFEDRDAATGRRYSIAAAEEFHYIGPDHSLDAYIAKNAVTA